jgi:Periplasmic copper-binding protein (NosD)
VSNVSVKNGVIAGFTFGIEMDYSGGHLVDGLRFSNDLEGVFCYKSKGCVVRNCQIEGGIYGVAFDQGTGNRASNNVATGVEYGFYSSGSDYFDSNYADNCTGSGIYAESSATKFRFNTTTNCNVAVYGRTSEGASDQMSRFP